MQGLNSLEGIDHSAPLVVWVVAVRRSRYTDLRQDRAGSSLNDINVISTYVELLTSIDVMLTSFDTLH